MQHPSYQTSLINSVSSFDTRKCFLTHSWLPLTVYLWANGGELWVQLVVRSLCVQVVVKHAATSGHPSLVLAICWELMPSRGRTLRWPRDFREIVCCYFLLLSSRDFDIRYFFLRMCVPVCKKERARDQTFLFSGSRPPLEGGTVQHLHFVLTKWSDWSL